MSERTNDYLYVHGSIAEFADDGDDMDRYYLPVRATAFGINRDTALIAIPETAMTTTYNDQLRVILSDLGQQAPNTIMIPDTDYFLDQAIRMNLDPMEDNLEVKNRYVVKPYANNQILRAWTRELRDKGYQLETPMSERVYFGNLRHPQHRGGWSVPVSDMESGSFALKYGLPYPRSFSGIGVEQILEARTHVLNGTDEPVFAKLMFSAGGFGVRKTEREEDLIEFYEEVRETGALYLFDREQPFEIQANIDNIVALASMQFSEGNVATPRGLAIQHMNVGNGDSHNWAGNMFNAGYESKLSQKALSLGHKIAEAYYQETGDRIEGGIDLAIVQNGDEKELKIIEPNIARSVGADPAIALGNAFDVSEKPFMIRKTGNPSSDLQTIWDMLKSEGLSFNPQTKQGIFPLLWIEGSGFLFTVGNSEQEIRSTTDRALKLAQENGYAR